MAVILSRPQCVQAEDKSAENSTNQSPVTMQQQQFWWNEYRRRIFMIMIKDPYCQQCNVIVFITLIIQMGRM